MNHHRIQTNLFLILSCLFLLTAPMKVWGQFAPKNDTTSAFTAKLNIFGRIETYDGTEGRYREQEDRMIHYMMPQVGLNDTLVWHVWSPPEDPIKSSTFFNSQDSSQFNKYILTDDSDLHPDTKTMNVSMLLRLWEGDNFGLVRYGVYNVLKRDSATAPVPDTTFKIAVNFRAKHYNSFGRQTLEYEQSSQRVYISGDGGVIAMQPIDIDPVAVRFLDDDEYGNRDTNEDNAYSSDRWDIITETETSSDLTTRENGGWAFMNFGDTRTLLPQDSTTFWMAFTHGNNKSEVNRRLDSAETRFDEITTSNPDKDSEAVAEQMQLNKNYPNPFNPQTTISFELPEPTSVSLKIYNVLGQEIRTLINRRMNNGKHSVRFNGAELSSGIYFYKLQAGGKTFTRRMTLIK